jgi:hypothetical protein
MFIQFLLFVAALGGVVSPTGTCIDQQSLAANHATIVIADTIWLANPSFEDKPGASLIPKGWISKTKGSTPDIMPGAWGINASPHGGLTCLGLVVREDNTSEDIAQVLSEPLKSGECYAFQIWLKSLPKYVGYNQPCQLRVYGGTDGGRDVLLAQSPLITQGDWKEYKLQFTPRQNCTSITLVAWYGPGVMFKYKGNILLDDISPIVRCNRA